MTFSRLLRPLPLEILEVDLQVTLDELLTAETQTDCRREAAREKKKKRDGLCELQKSEEAREGS